MSENIFVALLCTHNGAHFVEAQIQSIFEQTRPIDMVFVHDFASSDATREILARIQRDAPVNFVIHCHNDAPGPALSFLRNINHTLIASPPGAMFFFVDQDDVWLPNKLENVDKFIRDVEIQSSDIVLLFHDVHVVDESLNLIRSTYYTGNPFSLPRDIDGVRLMMSNPAIGHTMMLSSALAEMISEWPRHEDYLMHDWLAMLIASRFGKIFFIDSQLSMYRQHNANILGAFRVNSRVPSLRRLLRFTDRVIVQAVSYANAVTHYRNKRQRIILRYQYLDRYLSFGYRRTGLILFIAAFMYGPTWQRKALGAIMLLQAMLGGSGRRSE